MPCSQILLFKVLEHGAAWSPQHGQPCLQSIEGRSLVTRPSDHQTHLVHAGYGPELSRAEQEVVLASSIGHASAEKPHSESTKYYITTPSGYGFRNAGVFGDCLSVSTLHAQLPFRATESGDGWKCDCDGDLCPASNDEEKRLPETRRGLFPLDNLTVRTLRNRTRLPSSQPPRLF
jgi:hypothetical protein